MSEFPQPGFVDPLVALETLASTTAAATRTVVNTVDVDELRAAMAAAGPVTRLRAAALLARNEDKPALAPFAAQLANEFVGPAFGAPSDSQIVLSGPDTSPFNPINPSTGGKEVDPPEVVDPPASEEYPPELEEYPPESQGEPRLSVANPALRQIRDADSGDIAWLEIKLPDFNGRIGIAVLEVETQELVCTDVCLRRLDGDAELTTIITRKSTIVLEDQADSKLLEERLATITDPRAWDLATNPPPAAGEPTPAPVAGWLQSQPTTGDTGADDVDFATPIVTTQVGTSWNVADPLNFYELVWPGFNRPWGVMLKVNFNTDAPIIGSDQERSGWTAVKVDYAIGQHITLPGGPLGRKPVGPSLMPVTRDDGHMTITKTAGTEPRYLIEMVKELNFADIVTGRILDTVEVYMPFMAEGWFNSVNFAWLDAVVDQDRDVQWYQDRINTKTRKPPLPVTQP